MELVVIQKQGNLILNNQNPYRYVSRAEYRQSLLSEDVINISVESKTPLQFNIGDKIEYANRYFILNIAPKIKREQGFYSYDLVFEGVQYSLRNKIYFNLDKTGFQTSADFPLTGEIDIFLKVLVDNINSISDTRWILGEYPQNTDTKTLTFSNENCLAVLQKICQEWDTEFEMQENIVAKTITLNVKKIGNPLPYTFEYGQGNGLYTLTRDNEANDVITRLYAYGSTENIPNNYRDYSEKLRMPQSQGDYIQDDEKVRLFGLKEAVKTFDEVKPTFKGIISRVGAFDDYTKTQEIEVQNMDFDLNERAEDGSTKWLIPDTPVKLHFNKGSLAGYSFEVMKNEGYKHSTKVFKVKQFTDERGQKFPDIGTVFEFAVGDEFTLIDLVMPDVYLTRAENKLLEEARKEYEKVSRNNVKYSLDIDPLFLKSKGDEYTTFFRIGDYIHLVDKELNIDKNSRIINISRDLLNPFDFKIDIADTYEISFTQSVLQDIRDTKQVIREQKIINREQYYRGIKNLQELKDSVFDTDGHFDPIHIKPHSIEANMLSVGARSQHFTLENITLNPNVNGNPNKVSITTGRLVHLSIEDNVKEWTIMGIDAFDLVNAVYYVYAKVERNGVLGSWHITSEKIKFDQYSEHYYFLCYVLYTPKNGKRDAEAMYGNTLIHGGQVTTGRIQSIDGRTFFDLDTGEINGKIKFTADSPALTQVQGMVDNINIGGRNLLRNANFKNNAEHWHKGSPLAEFSITDRSAKIIHSLNTYNEIHQIVPCEPNTEYCVSAIVKGNGIARIFMLEKKGSGNTNVYKDHSHSFNLTNEYQRVSFTFRTQPDADKFYAIFRVIENHTVYFKDLKIEKGNKPTDWTPAPEDIETSINTANTTGLNAQNTANTALGKFGDLGALAWKNAVERAQLGKTIIQGGYIKTELLNASAIVSNGGGTTNTQLQQAINSLAIGGRNLVLESGTPKSKGVGWIIYPIASVDISGEHTLQIWLENTTPSGAGVGFGNTKGYDGRYFDYPHLQNGVYTKTLNINKGNNTHLCIWVNNQTTIRKIKLEKGNKPTDWTPAPEDLDAQFQNLQNGINGVQNNVNTLQNGISNIQTSLGDIKTKTDNFTSIQGGLISSNIISVGSTQINQNAFISGVTDAGGLSVRFGAGANYANKNNAPFRVLDNGKMIATDAEITGVIGAQRGKIGNFEIKGGWLTTGNENTWESGYSVSLTDKLFIMRDVGINTDQRREIVMGQTAAMSAGAKGATMSIKNTLNEFADFSPVSLIDHSALQLEAKNGKDNFALDILAGGIRVGGKIGYNGTIKIPTFDQQRGKQNLYEIEITSGIITNITRK